MDLTGDTILGALFSLGVFGGILWLVLPEYFGSFWGWAAASYLVIPGVLLVAALAANMPGLLVGGLFIAGILAAGK